MVTISDVTTVFDRLYPPELAESWDAVGLVCGDPSAGVRKVYFCVDVVAATVDEALEWGADLLVAHHPLLLRGVTAIPASTPKGRTLHRLIRAGAGLFVAHTNADSADPGVSDALAARFDLRDLRPLHPRPDAANLGIGRIGTLPEPLTAADLTALAARVLPATPGGVRLAGDPGRVVRTVAVSGGAGDSYLGDATGAGVDAFLTADLRHHPASEHAESGGPALLDAAHWATEQPWLAQAAAALVSSVGPATVETFVSDLVTDPWTRAVVPDHPREGAS
ncbi:Nif3-like dinuclear metal center hexameric protein [Cryptosporangium arvum]|uniref:GTP cyclohydrolase 1 type 2 homolog n=1 Tax=Cryptosporangium arvum DSM 44712 TaxID=927661 RepID=A0A010Z035_9ACTN|nr:Nif3-like dinuclear metal center hexameric protein [Cryptosporangium arvum]EXG80803.1 dinuclear metal center protein, YbgI/SA1388 family [Cryptosporangium arvum DSM 44712]